jgi:hypothetical protein
MINFTTVFHAIALAPSRKEFVCPFLKSALFRIANILTNMDALSAIQGSDLMLTDLALYHHYLDA